MSRTWLAFGATEPGRHGVGKYEPTEHDDPGGHGRQSVVTLLRKPTAVIMLGFA